MTRAVVVMGPAGSGKTTIGESLASRLGWTFIEGDALHPESNVQKMAAGIPLDDDDRRPWLETLARALTRAAADGQNVVLACSALKESYRRELRVHPGVTFVFLDAPADVLRERIRRRKGHFVPVGLVESQLETLERPAAGWTVDATRPPEAVVDEVVRRL